MPHFRKITQAEYEARPPRRRSATRRSFVDRTPEILPTPRDKRGITRIDHPTHRTHGWFVRIYGGKRPCASKFFSDLKHGGVEAALAAAELWRDAARAAGS
jgi:hypothetical protein